MSKQANRLLLGRILIQRGLLTEAQLAEALAEQARTDAPLGKILTARKWVAAEKFNDAIAFQKEIFTRKPHESTKGEVAYFGQKVQELKLATAEQVNAALRVQGKAWEDERRIRHLGEILVEQGVLNVAQVLTVLNAQGKTLGVCKVCNSRFNVAMPQPGASLPSCALCGGALESVTSSAADVSFRGEAEEFVREEGGESIVYGGGAKSVLADLPDAPAVSLPTEAIKGTRGARGVPSSRVSGARSVEEMLAKARADERYAVEREVNRGGMGSILSAVDRDIRREVAMKVILPEKQVNRERLKRFVEEAQVTGQLEHPNIVPVHELGVDKAGRIYFTMKLVRGRSLGEVLKEQHKRQDQALTAAQLSELLSIFLKVCDGVAFAHSKGVVHRDLKPANIMVGQFGEVLVMDWGLAKVKGLADAQASEVIDTVRSESDVSKTLDGQVVGSASYMPPEQAEGELDKIDERSDIYSLGAVLYEMLTLLPPFRGLSVTDVIAQVAQGKLKSPECTAPKRGIPRELSAICMKALAYERDYRYASVQDLAKDVMLYLEGRAVSAKEDSFVETIVKGTSKNSIFFEFLLGSGVYKKGINQ